MWSSFYRLSAIPKCGPKPAAERGSVFRSSPSLCFQVFAPETTTLYQVTSVTSPDPDGTYAPGDVITVEVAFDRHVSVVGDPVFNLNTGKGEPGRADYVAGSGSQARANAQQGCWLDGGGFFKRSNGQRQRRDGNAALLLHCVLVYETMGVRGNTVPESSPVLCSIQRLRQLHVSRLSLSPLSLY